MKQKKIAKEQIDAEKAFQVHQAIVEREQTRRELLLMNIEALFEMFEKQYYRVILGDAEATWSGYLGQVEIYYSRAQVERWRKIWKGLIVERKLNSQLLLDVPETRLEEIASFADDDVEDLIEKAKVLSSQEWRDTILAEKGLPDHYDCEHKFKVFQECGKCGSRLLVEMMQEHNESEHRKV